MDVLGFTTQILFLSSQPQSEAQTLAGLEFEALRKAVAESPPSADVKLLNPRLEVSPDELFRTIADSAPQVLHFCGHGGRDGGLILADGQRSILIEPHEFNSIIQRAGSPRIRLIVLTACGTRELCELLAGHIEVVVGTSARVGGDVAIEFVSAFYEVIVRGGAVEDAFELGRVRAGYRSADENVFILRAGEAVDPSAVRPVVAAPGPLVERPVKRTMVEPVFARGLLELLGSVRWQVGIMLLVGVLALFARCTGIAT